MGVLVVGAEKGGVGKTCLAVNLASLAACAGVETLLVDTDPTGSATAWNRIRAESGVTPNIPVISVYETLARELPVLAKKFELVVVDIGANSRSSLGHAALQADLMLVPTGPDQFEVESTIRVFQTLERLGVHRASGKIPAHIVLTRMPTASGSKDERLLREHLAEYQLPVCQSVCRLRSSWRLVGRSGMGLHEMRGRDRDPRAAEEITNLFNEMTNLFGDHQ